MQISGNHRFVGSELLMSNRAQAFTKNYPLTSLCSAHGTHVVEFEVTKWVGDGDLIFLDNEQSPDYALELLHTPGHTFDSLSIFYRLERRLFVGDLIYPYTAIPISAVGSDVNQYAASIARLQAFVRERQVLVLSCGHVEANLDPASLQDMAALLARVRDGVLPPSSAEEDGVAQYSGGQFHVLIPLDVRWDNSPHKAASGDT